MAVRGLRGATTVQQDHKTEIEQATKELLYALVERNPGLRSEDIASVIFSVTDDICQDYPARAARIFGWDQVPLMCTREIPVPGGLPLCIRVLVHWNVDRPQSEIQHVYLRQAVKLRPDLQR